MSGGLVTIGEYAFSHEAEMARGFLETNGIEVFVADEAMSRIANHLTPIIGGAKLQVREEDAELALQLLADVESGEGPPIVSDSD